MIVLASASPRRAQLLRAAGYNIQVEPASLDESVRPGEAATDYVERIAEEKALAVQRRLLGSGLPGREVPLILAADTCVLVDQQILGKPASYTEFKEMMSALSGRGHWVHSAIALADMRECLVQRVDTRVYFRALSLREIDAYWQTTEPLDKAGGYAIQGYAAAFVERIEGSYSSVVGLPLCETVELLRRKNIEAVWSPV